MEDKKILSEVQQGFRRGRRGADNTFVLNTIVMKGVATGKKPHLAFLDIKKMVFSLNNIMEILVSEYGDSV